METSSTSTSGKPVINSSPLNTSLSEPSSKNKQNEFDNPSYTVNPISNSFRNSINDFVTVEALQKFKKPFQLRIFALFIYLVATTLLTYRLGFELFGWWIGGIIGFFLLDTDHLLDVYFLHPHNESNQRIKALLRARNWSKAWQTLLITAHKRSNLVLHSVVFEVIVLLLTLYVITSHGRTFGYGLILAFWFRILFEQAKEFLHTGKMNSWFWQIKGDVSINLQSVFLAVGIIVWIIMNIARL